MIRARDVFRAQLAPDSSKPAPARDRPARRADRGRVQNAMDSLGAMSDVVADVPPRAHARIVYLGPVSPHWEVYGDWGERTLLDEFRARVLARLVLLPA